MRTAALVVAVASFGISACGSEPRDAGTNATATEGPAPMTSATAPGSESTGGSTGLADETGATKLDVGGGADLGGGFAASCDDVEALPSNQGCEFWAVDLPNVSVINPPGLITPPADQQFAVVVSNPSSSTTANVEIFVGDGDAPVASGPVPLDTIRVFELDPLGITPGVTGADGTAYRIVSDLPIVAYQFQPLDNANPVYSNDATILFPTHVLDGDYVAVTGDALLVGADGFATSDTNTGAFVSVVGTEDGTTVTLYPTAGLHPGAVAGVTIDRGQVLTAISSERGAPSWGNLSGTRVVADRPVAVFSGSVATSEPAGTQACCADHLEHQMLPLTAWGTAYLAAPAAAATGNGSDESLFRVTAGFDGTELAYDPAPPPGAPTTLDAYETVAFVTDQPFAVRSTDAGKTIAVAQFLLSNQHFAGLGRPGDPSMILVPAAAQLQRRYAFLVPQGYTSDFVTVVRPIGATTALDGAPIAQGFLPLGEYDGAGYEYAHVAVAPGGHVIEGDAAFGITVVGYAQDVSYGYVGGSGVEVIGEAPPPPG